MFTTRKTFVPRFELLETRECPAVLATLSAGVLTVIGDQAANTILVSDQGADGILDVTSDGQAVTIQGGVASKDAVATIRISGQGGDDDLRVDASVNTLDAAGLLARSPDVVLQGGKGNDTLATTNGGIVGGLAGVVNGVVVGPVVGNAFLDGGAGNDLLFSGLGNDVIRGGKGADTYVWLPGTLTDSVDLGAGQDTGVIVGNDGAADAFVLGQDADGQVVFQRTNLVNFTVFFDNTETISLQPGTGDDSVVVNNLDGTDVKRVQIDGGDGADSISVARQRRVQVSVAPDPADLVLLDQAFGLLAA
jgi:Ca2+-binding RTX toxin-like protein